MRADLEITGGVIRLLPGGGRFGAPFVLAMSLVGDEGVATVKGLKMPDGRAFSRAIWTAVTAELRDRGFHTLRYSRHRNGEAQWKLFALVPATR